jgi:NADH:ubiquinone oxidoreductase subunit E
VPDQPEDLDYWREPQGDTVIRVCRAFSCNQSGAKDVVEDYERCLGIGVGHTTPDNRFTLKETWCFGRCPIGPNVRINQKFFAYQKPGMAAENLKGVMSDE